MDSNYREFPKLRIKQFASIQDKETPEAKYWRKLAVTSEQKLLAAVTCVDFNPADRGKTYVLSYSTKVSLFNSLDDKLQRSFSRFQDSVFCGKFRPTDGKLLAAGDKLGFVKVFDVKTKAVLRDLQAHRDAIHSLHWACDGLSIFSASDDKFVRQTDLATQNQLWSCNEHSDYVRALDSHPKAKEMFLTGSYDHSLRLWDTRMSSNAIRLQHTQPIDCCRFGTSGNLAIASNGNEVWLWDLVAGGKLLHKFSNHQKNITDICFNSSGSKILSSALDGFIKVYSMAELQVIHSMKYDQPIMSCGLSPDDKKLIAAYVDGSVIVRNYKQDISTSEEDEVDAVWKQSIQPQDRFYKGRTDPVSSDENHAVIESQRSIKLKPYENYLKKFQYQFALDAALKTRNPLVIITMLEELCRRSGISIALSGRDDVSLEPVLSFLSRYISNPRYSELLIQVTQGLLDLYGHVLGHSEAIDELFNKLHKQVKTEIRFQRQLMNILGSLDGVVNASLLQHY